MTLQGRIKPNTKAKKKLSDAERKQKRIERAHRRLISGIFNNAGFVPISEIRERQFTFKYVTSDFDDCFVFENVIVLLEYTTASESNVGDHLKNKQGVYNLLLSDPVIFYEFLKENFPILNAKIDRKYHNHHVKIVIIYCSLNPVKRQHKDLVPGVIFFDYHIARYFDTVSRATRSSSRFEILDYLNLSSSDVGDAVLTHADNIQLDQFHCSILPEGHSNFGKDFKVVSFYASPASMLERACVLRRYGWREGEGAYQRLISPKKILDIRRYLKEEGRVFVNNIIATLPSETKLIDEKGNTIDPSKIVSTTPGRLQLPREFNSVGLVDGQHRVYSYHEGGTHEKEIKVMRSQQNLLITGVIFPDGMSNAEKLKFEARLFLEINSNQMSAKSEIKQELISILDPFSADSISRKIVTKLNDAHGPLQDKFQRFEFEKDVMKSSSVVSFALKPLVLFHGPMYSCAPLDIIESLARGEDFGLAAYVDFCTKEINNIFNGVKASIPNCRWTADRKIEDHFLTTRNVNAIIACLRAILKRSQPLSIDQYREALKGFDGFDSTKFGSSKYNAMGEAIFKQFFSDLAKVDADTEK